MVDQLDSNTRSPNPDAEIDDPLAELARIIGYERPAERAAAADDAPQSSEFDLEAELMRELDVPQIPAVDEIDVLEADDADPEAWMDEGSDPEVVQFSESDEAAAEDPWLETRSSDQQASDPQEWAADGGSSPETFSGAHEDEFALDPREMMDAEQPVSHHYAAPDNDAADDGDQANDAQVHDEWQDPWAASEADAEPELRAEYEPEFAAYDSEPVEDQPAQVTETGFGDGSKLAPPDIPDDDVLADMFRFEIPARQSTATPSASAAEVQSEDAAAWAAEASFDRDMEDFPSGSEGQDDYLPADVAEEEFEPSLDPEPIRAADQSLFDEPPVEAAPAQAPNGAVLDFEDFLSTELDSFEQTLASQDAAVQDDGTDETLEASGHAGFEAEAEQDGWDDSSTDGESSVFDDAAEELLADIADDEGMPEHAAVPADTSEGWSEDGIENAVAEELDEELEDMFGFPDPAQEPGQANSDASDDLDFDLDLDQVLADTAVFLDNDWAEPEAVASADPAQSDSPEPDAWQVVAPAAPGTGARDEMAEAFLGLVPAEENSQPDPAPVPLTVAALPDRQDTPSDQDDWLDGFETVETAEQAGQNDYYFDPQLISEPDVGVEAVADIDVPELVHDDPQPVEPDYDTDIEREFADIVDVSDAGSGAAVSASFASTEAWGRTDAAPRGYETSDDYIALERELGVEPSGHSYQGSQAHPDELAYADGDLAYVDDDGVELAEEPAQRERGSRGSVLALAVLGIAVLAGAGALGWSMLSGDDTVADGGPRIIRADTEPVKVLPENPGGMTVPNQDKAVYDRVAGDDANSPGQPSLVNTAEEPVDVVQRTLDPEVLPLEGRGDVTEKSEERLAADGAGADGASDTASAPVVSPRRVRTMIVKPDGSIVAREELEPAPEPEAAVAQPASALAEPTITEAMTAEPAVLDAAAPAEPASQAAPVEQAATEPAADAETATPALAPGSANAPAAEQSIAPVRVVTTQPIRAPVPQNRPADQPVTVVGTVTQGGDVANPQSLPAAQAQPAEVASAPAAAAPAATAPAAAVPVANPGGYFVQIASQPSEEGAQASWQALSSRYNSVIGGRGVDIQRADIPGKGVFHRVRIPAGTRDEANALCERYKSAGGSCFVSR
ncbi:MAG: SPOR domain-containing protein [Hoeflea sp.]|uniref:SPOR domain-containing protein n=1 Tax=Hoeflea sp. TaxID=1940281 RepID=UPI001D8D8577|nr:SPOR domain-containing protein [Hoeflea sp.]MBU4530716.1 SPOR domain-containing protein [Alphaproteobacteria bacterium]MBU4544936.1 SPOR domain-containing protein [Alphaproteobacteria bacterium]MBU4552079.1 SPOR domain-containing protein [Alphaproteobacteria bacterium]MBV1722268.1 SPOR domain-containing protein [Hoeflea sp.]MBV1761830.1 SPOR domain-containing protein [Hoeflea sp.]